MHIIVPYVAGSLQPETERSLTPWPGPVEKKLLADPYEYWNLIRECWLAGVDFCLVEQDMAPTVDQLAGLEDCPEEFCSYPYMRESVETLALGLTRLRGSFTRRYRTLLELETPPRVHYSECDGWLYGRIAHTGMVVHRHSSYVAHYRRQTVLVGIPGTTGEAGWVR